MVALFIGLVVECMLARSQQRTQNMLVLAGGITILPLVGASFLFRMSGEAMSALCVVC